MQQFDQGGHLESGEFQNSLKDHEDIDLLVKEFSTYIKDISHQNNQISRYMSSFYESSRSNIISPVPPVQKEQQKTSEEQTEIDMLKEELKIYKNLKCQYDETINKINESNQKQIDQIKSQLINTVMVEEQYGQINDNLQRKIQKKEHEIDNQREQQKQIQEVVSALKQEITLKDNLIHSLDQIKFQQDFPSSSKVDYIQQRHLKQICLLKNQLKKMKNQNNLQDCNQVLYRQESTQDEFWKDRCQVLKFELETSNKQIHQLLAKSTKEKKLNKQLMKQITNRKKQDQQTQSKDENKSELMLQLLSENQQLRSQVKDSKFKGELQMVLPTTHQLPNHQNDQQANSEVLKDNLFYVSRIKIYRTISNQIGIRQRNLSYQVDTMNKVERYICYQFK